MRLQFTRFLHWEHLRAWISEGSRKAMHQITIYSILFQANNVIVPTREHRAHIICCPNHESCAVIQRHYSIAYGGSNFSRGQNHFLLHIMAQRYNMIHMFRSVIYYDLGYQSIVWITEIIMYYSPDNKAYSIRALHDLANLMYLYCPISPKTHFR